MSIQIVSTIYGIVMIIKEVKSKIVLHLKTTCKLDLKY